jgi:hypothetical protein
MAKKLILNRARALRADLNRDEKVAIDLAESV